MERGSTLFLKPAVIPMVIPVLALCIFELLATAKDFAERSRLYDK